jgi:hypothetical protein
MSNPIERLEQIQEELAALGAEAAEIFQENFPSLHDQGEAYGAFEFGVSSNPYDTTLASLIESAQGREQADHD